MSDAQSLIERGIRESDSLQHLKVRDTFKLAIDLFTAAGDRDGKFEAMRRLAKAHYDEGNDKEALELWEQMIEEGITAPDIFDFLLGYYAHQGKDEEALRVWRFRNERLPGDEASQSDLVTVAECHLRLGDADEAERLYQQAMARSKSRGQRWGWVYEKFGLALMKLDKPVEAAEIFVRGIAETAQGGAVAPAALARGLESAFRKIGVERPAAYTSETLNVLADAGVDAAKQRIRSIGLRD